MNGRGEWTQRGKPCRWRGTRQPTTREGEVGPDRVAEKLVLPRRPGNAGGGKELQVEGWRKGAGSREWLTPSTPEMSSNAGRRHMHKRRGRP